MSSSAPANVGQLCMADAVAACIHSCTKNGTGWQASLLFPGDFLGFQGHFPGQPVLPGVCLIEAVAQVCARQRAAPVRIRSIDNAKFFRPVGPGQRIELQATFCARKDTEEVRAELAGPDGPVAEIILRLIPASA